MPLAIRLDRGQCLRGCSGLCYSVRRRRQYRSRHYQYRCQFGSSYPQCAYVTNYAFSGGTNASSYSYVQQSDINNAVSRATALYQGAEIAAGQSSVAGQMRSGERMFGGTGCSSHYTHSPAAGTRNVSTVTAGIWVTCSAEVYDYNGALAMAASLLKQSITSTPNESLLGKITTSMLSVYASNGAIIMKVAAQGTEVYTFST